MEEQTIESQKNSTQMQFFGKGSEYFGIIIVNWLLTVLTLGIYYPWARARKIRYMYGATALNNDRFAFHGTGKEMFRGFVKVIIFYAVLMGALYAAMWYYRENPTGLLIFVLLFYIVFFAVIPLIIHGAYRYRMSRTTWRGIRFGYRGEKQQLYINFFKWLGLTFVTLGVYISWFEINLRKYLVGNIRTGDIKFEYKGNGWGLFKICMKYFAPIFAGVFVICICMMVMSNVAGDTIEWGAFSYLWIVVTIIMVFVYGFALIYYCWFEKNVWNYYIDNIELKKDEQKIELKSSVTGGGIFKLRFVNFLMTVFSLGLAYAWVEVRTRKYFTENITLTGDIDLDKISQTEEIYTDAAFESAGDFFDIDIF